MGKSEIRGKVTCRRCGAQSIEVPDESDDSCVVTCSGCGENKGTWGDIKAAAMKKTLGTVKGSFRTSLKKAVKGSKNIRFK